MSLHYLAKRQFQKNCIAVVIINTYQILQQHYLSVVGSMAITLLEISRRVCFE